MFETLVPCKSCKTPVAKKAAVPLMWAGPTWWWNHHWRIHSRHHRAGDCRRLAHLERHGEEWWLLAIWRVAASSEGMGLAATILESPSWPLTQVWSDC
jgi:hypothetical protein